MKTQKRYSPIQKVEILREHLDNHVSISDLSDRFNVSPAMIYYWKKQLFEGAITLFKNNKKDQFKFKELQDKDPKQLVEDAKQYAREKPGQAILISAAVGLILGLLLKRR